MNNKTMNKQNEIKIMKTISEGICPFCSKKIMVSIKSSLPMNDWILKMEDIEDAKKKLKAEIEKIKFENKDRRENMLKFIANPENMFGPSEVQPMLSQITMMNEMDKKEKQS